MGQQQPSLRRTRSESAIARDTGKQLLSNFKQHQIQGSWLVAKRSSKDPVGQRIFMRVFRRSDELQKIFTLEDVPYAKLKKDSRFVEHAGKIEAKLDLVVENIHDLKLVRSTLFNLGLKHAEIVKMLGITRFDILRHWDAIAEAIVFCVTEGQKFPGLYASWRKLVCWMMNEMRDGLMSEKLFLEPFAPIAIGKKRLEHLV